MAKAYNDDNRVGNYGHDNEGINRVANEFGLSSAHGDRAKQTQAYENLAFTDELHQSSDNHYTTTLDQLKENVYNKIVKQF